MNDRIFYRKLFPAPNFFNDFADALYEATIGKSAYSTLFDKYSDRIQAALDESLNK